MKVARREEDKTKSAVTAAIESSFVILLGHSAVTSGRIAADTTDKHIGYSKLEICPILILPRRMTVVLQ